MDGRVKPGHDTKMESPWSLHPQLAQDTVPIGDLALSHVLLANDANYLWLILLPRQAGLVEIIDLSYSHRLELMDEIADAASALKVITECDRLNIAALGNQVHSCTCM